MKRPIYLDHHATTPVDPRVFEEMCPFFTERFGNPSSRSHPFGWEAEEAVESARGEIARLIGAGPGEIVFTSGATESNNLALKGAAEAWAGRGDHIITVATEHRSVLDPARHLERAGIRVTVLPVAPDGLVDPDQVRAHLTPGTFLISVMAANNETGVLQPIGALGALAQERGILFHTDAVQALGRVPLDVERDRIDLLSVSAHKVYGPKGVGALYVRRREGRVWLPAQMEGGGQERGVRPGTLNVPGIVGFGKACALARTGLSAEQERLAALRDRLAERLLGSLDGIRINGSRVHRLANNLSVSFEGVDGEALFAGLPELALSNGSACTSATKAPSHVLTAMGLSESLARATLRFGLGRSNTAEEIDQAADRVIATVRRLRAP